MPTDGRRINRPGPTEQQRRALDARGTSVAVSAGAGCGKTFVLTERFLAELQPEGTKSRDHRSSSQSHDRRSRLGQVVAITFTERAAREMRERIRSACNRRLRECDDAEVTYWLGLVRELDSARVSTIHSFCASLLRSHAVEARLDPRFRVLDGVQAGTILFELTDDVLRERLADSNEAALSLVAPIRPGSAQVDDLGVAGRPSGDRLEPVAGRDRRRAVGPMGSVFPRRYAAAIDRPAEPMPCRRDGVGNRRSRTVRSSEDARTIRRVDEYIIRSGNVFGKGCHCWLVQQWPSKRFAKHCWTSQQCPSKRLAKHCWTSQQWHP